MFTRTTLQILLSNVIDLFLDYFLFNSIVHLFFFICLRVYLLKFGFVFVLLTLFILPHFIQICFINLNSFLPEDKKYNSSYKYDAVAIFFGKYEIDIAARKRFNSSDSELFTLGLSTFIKLKRKNPNLKLLLIGGLAGNESYSQYLELIRNNFLNFQYKFRKKDIIIDLEGDSTFSKCFFLQKIAERKKVKDLLIVSGEISIRRIFVYLSIFKKISCYYVNTLSMMPDFQYLKTAFKNLYLYEKIVCSELKGIVKFYIHEYFNLNSLSDNTLSKQ